MNAAPESVRLVCIGALTNIAAAIGNDRANVAKIREVVFMGAGVTYPEHPLIEFREGAEFVAAPSHNVTCDVEAARRVFESGLPVRVLTNDVTTRVWWDGESVQELILAEAPPEAVAVGSMLQLWLCYRSSLFGSSITGTCPHDPLTIAESIYPERFVKYATGRISVRGDGSTAFVADSGGPHRVGVEVNISSFLAWLPKQLLG